MTARSKGGGRAVAGRYDRRDLVAGRAGWGPDITVTQDAKTLTIQVAQFSRSDMQPPMKFVYRLDGSERRNTINMGRGPQEQVSRATWEGTRRSSSPRTASKSRRRPSR
jgi:hypothetical protein